MKIRYCRRCDTPITNSAHALYCPKCREIVKKERISARRDAYNAWRRKRYAEKKQGTKPVTETPPKVLTGMSPASRRWATMSWYDLCKELDYYKLKYRDAQLMAQNNTLPEDFGLRRKRTHHE